MEARSLDLSARRRQGNQENSLLNPEGALTSLSKFVTGLTRQYFEPPQRCCPILQTINGKVFGYGGSFNSKLSSNQSLAVLGSKVYVYDPNTEQWTVKDVGGELIPPGISDTASVAIHNDLYVYGGCDLYGNVTNSLYRFDTKSLSWYRLLPQYPDTGPIKVRGCGLIAFGNRNLGVFGGTWLPFSRDGCTNRFHVYDLQTGKHNS